MNWYLAGLAKKDREKFWMPETGSRRLNRKQNEKDSKKVIDKRPKIR